MERPPGQRVVPALANTAAGLGAGPGLQAPTRMSSRRRRPTRAKSTLSNGSTWTTTSACAPASARWTTWCGALVPARAMGSGARAKILRCLPLGRDGRPPVEGPPPQQGGQLPRPLRDDQQGRRARALHPHGVLCWCVPCTVNRPSRSGRSPRQRLTRALAGAPRRSIQAAASWTLWTRASTSGSAP